MSGPKYDTVPSFAIPTDEQLASIPELTAPENAWYASVQRFPDNQSLLEAVSQGELVRVEGDLNSAPIYRLRNRDRDAEFTPFLTPHAARTLRALGVLWRTEMITQGIERNDLRLAVTSLARSQQVQQRLVDDPTKFANPLSSHCAAAAFDIDAAGYYVSRFGREGGFLAVSHPERARVQQQDVAAVLSRGDNKAVAMRHSREAYDPGVIEALLTVTGKLHAMGAINQIVEFPGTPNQCVHIAPNPSVNLPSPSFVTMR